jgi:hypothetical protein
MAQRHDLGGWWPAAALLLIVTGCPADDTSGADTGAATTAPGDSTAADSGIATDGATSMASVTATATATTGTTGECPDCGDGLWCDWGVNSCGGESDQGTGCDAVYQPVCGCDGNVYGNECEAHSAGVDVSQLNECTPPKGAFPCGQTFCDLATDYCQVAGSDIGGEPNGYGCVPLPAACGDTPACDCLAAEPCFDFGCGTSPEGGLSITCPGG